MATSGPTLLGELSFKSQIVDSGRLPLFVCLLAFVATFVTTRVITRMIRAGRGPFKDNVTSSGVHVHHAVPGMALLIIGAFTACASDVASGWSIVAGVLIGIGTSLVLDEFALIVHLSDVYWSHEGRISVELVGLAVAALGLALLGLNPTGLDPGETGQAAVLSLTAVLIHVALLVVVVAKGKYRLALFGAFIPTLAMIGALRLARPGSLWARRWYHGARSDRAARRVARHDARWGPYTAWITDFVAGKPTDEVALATTPDDT